MGSKTRSPSKQRQRITNASSFRRSKLINVRLSRDLQKKYNVKRMPLRTGDVVFITTGDFVGTEGKVLGMDYKNQRAEIDGIAREKADKSKIIYPIHTSNMIIRRFGKIDKSRKAILERKAKKVLEIEAEDLAEEIDFEEE